MRREFAALVERRLVQSAASLRELRQLRLNWAEPALPEIEGEDRQALVERLVQEAYAAQDAPSALVDLYLATEVAGGHDELRQLVERALVQGTGRLTLPDLAALRLRWAASPMPMWSTRQAMVQELLAEAERYLPQDLLPHALLDMLRRAA